MNSTKLTNALLLVCVALLGFIAIQVTTLSTYNQVSQIDNRTKTLATAELLELRMQMLAQHVDLLFVTYVRKQRDLMFTYFKPLRRKIGIVTLVIVRVPVSRGTQLLYQLLGVVLTNTKPRPNRQR